jgi:N-acetylglucosamine-6-phosphate deacetylase
MGPEPAGHARTAPSAISAGRIFDGHRWHNNAVIVIDRGMVQCIAPRDQSAGDWLTEVMPAGTLLAPGFIDLQVNGGGGVLLNDDPTPDAMRAIARAHRRYGTTSCLPTLISDTRAKAAAAMAAVKSMDGTDGILGFISKDRLLVARAPGFIGGTVYWPRPGTIWIGSGSSP